MTSDSCKAAGLPPDFCKRVAVEAYNTDSVEWDNVLAHAQMQDGVPPCESANDLMARMSTLGGEFQSRVDHLATANSSSATEDLAGQVAIALGRALHTVQDNRAHHGMPNPEHAWYSLQDLCEGTTSAPDLRPGSLDEARTATDEMMVRAAEAIHAAGVASALGANACPATDPDDPQARDLCYATQMPAPWDLCSFLAEGKVWDGIDRQWDRDLIGAAMFTAFWTSTSSDMCLGPELMTEPGASVDTSGGIPTCAKAHLLCLGKVDDPSLPVSEADPTQPAEAPEGSSGCAVSARAFDAPWACMLACTAIALAGRRRRKR